MGNNDLKILINASLNIGKSIDEINTQIKGLQKKVNSLKLNVEVNDKVLSKLQNFSKQMERLKDSALNTGKVIEEALMPDGTKIKRTFFDGLNGEFSEVIKKAKQTTENLNNQSLSVDDLTEGYKKLIKEVERYNASQKKLGGTITVSDEKGINTRTINVNAKDNATSFKDTYNAAKEEKLNKKLSEGIDKLKKKYEELRASGNLTEKQLEELVKAINLAKDLNSLELAKKKYEELVDKAKLAEQMARGREQANQRAYEAEKKSLEELAKASNKALEEEYKNNLKISEVIQKRKEQLQSLLRETANKGYLSTNELREVGTGIFKSNSLDELNKYERKLDILIDKQKELKRQANLGTQISQADSSLFDFGRQDDLKQFMNQFHDGEIKITKFKESLQDGKNRVVEFNVQVQKGEKEVEEYKYYFDQLTGAIYRNSAALKNNSNNHLGFAEQLKIAISRTFTWATAMTA